MKKKIILLLMMLLPMVAGAETVLIDSIYYNLYSKIKEAEVTNSMGGDFYGRGSYSGRLAIPATVTYSGIEYIVTRLGEYVFHDCSGLTSIMIPNSVTSMGSCAFMGCSGLTSVTIPNSVTSIGSYAFRDCSGLTSIAIPNSVTSIGQSAFIDCSGLTSITIPNSITNLEVNVFAGCSGLTSVTIPNSVTSIRDGSFQNCRGLNSVTIPNSVTSMGSYAFRNCSSLTSVTIPNSVTSIGYSAFEGCSGLTSVTIGSGVIEIRSCAFASCKELTDVYCLAEEVPAMTYNGSSVTDAFQDSYIEHATLHVPFASIDAYKAVEPWKNFKRILALSGQDIPENPKCDKPNIIKEGNKFWFVCETPGATFKSKLTPNVEEQEFEGSEMVFVGSDITYTLTVIASAEGYEDSDPVKMTLTVDNCDTNKDGKVDVADIATIIDRMAGKARRLQTEE